MAGYGEPDLYTVEAHGLTLGIVATRWHGELVDHMVDRAEAAAKACGVDEVHTVRVAGSVELPVVAQALAGSASLATMTTGSFITATVPSYSPTGHWTLMFAASVPSEPAARRRGARGIAGGG